MFGRGSRHILWFPFLLLALTIILAVTIVVVDDDRRVVASPALDNESTAPPMTDAEYKTQAVRLMVSVWGADLAETSVDDLKSLRDQLVVVRVPGSMRDVHIKLVAAINQRIAGVEGDVEAAADALIRLNALQIEQPWLR